MVRTITKHECLNQLNTLAGSNQVSIIWVPGHSGIHGNERADELAGIGASEACLRLWALNRPLLSLSQFSSGTQRSGLSLNQKRRWRYSKHGAKTKSVVRRIKGKISTHLKNIRITGHGPFRDHLALMKLTDEPSCPKCGANTDSNIHFIFDLLQKDQKKVTEC